MKKWLKSLVTFTAACFALLFFRMPAFAAGTGTIEDPWQVGDNAYAYLDGTTLVIDGSGDCWDVDNFGKYKEGHGSLMPIGEKKPYQMDAFDTIQIGAGITGIGERMFDNSLQTPKNLILLGDAITYVGEEAFSHAIANPAFDNENFKNLSYIGHRAFSGNEFTGELSLPAIEFLGAYSFSQSSIGTQGAKFSTVTLGNGTNETVLYHAFDYSDNEAMPEAVLNYNIRKMLPGTVKPFQNNFSVIHVALAVEEIGADTFASTCAKEIDLPVDGNLSVLGDRCFADNQNLTSIQIPAGIISIGNAVLKDCPVFTDLYFYTSDMERVDMNTSFGNPGTLPTGYTIHVMESVKTVPELLANEEKTLTKVVFDAIGTEKIGNNAFSGCANLSTISFPQGSTLSWIGDYSFEKTGLTELSIPENVKYIGYAAFQECRDLRTITVPSNIADSAFSGLSAFAVMGSFDYDSNADGLNDLLTTTVVTDNRKTLFYDWKADHRYVINQIDPNQEPEKPNEPGEKPGEESDLGNGDDPGNEDPGNGSDSNPGSETDPKPTPEPEKKPDPAPQPTPQPTPIVIPVPEPQPIVIPTPQPVPVPTPTIIPDPTPTPKPTAKTPEKEERKSEKAKKGTGKEEMKEESPLIVETKEKSVTVAPIITEPEKTKVVSEEIIEPETEAEEDPEEKKPSKAVPILIGAGIAGGAVAVGAATGAFQHLWMLLLPLLRRRRTHDED